MNKALIGIAMLAASLGLCVVASGGGAGAASTEPAVATTVDIAFTEGFCSDDGAHCKVIGDRAKPMAYVNILVFTIPLTSGGAQIGVEEGQCTNLTKASRSNFCTYDLKFDDGAVSVQGTLPYTNQGKGPAIPVTGGTRTYLGAYGSLRMIPETRDYELHLVIPG